MKAITVKQPWASLIVGGHKNVENRNWRTNYRGPLAIHAGKRPAHVNDWAFVDMLAETGICPSFRYKDVPLGAVLGTVELVDVVQNLDNVWAAEGAFHWILENAVKFDEPVPATGKLGFWEWGNDESISSPD